MTVSVLPTPATSPITTHSGPGDEREQAGAPMETTRAGAGPGRIVGQKSASGGTCVPQFGQFTRFRVPGRRLRGLRGLLEVAVEALAVDLDLPLDRLLGAAQGLVELLGDPRLTDDDQRRLSGVEDLAQVLHVAA